MEDGRAVRVAVFILALVLCAARKVVGADAVLLALVPRAAVLVAVGVRVDAVVGVGRAVPLAVELLAVGVHEDAVPRRLPVAVEALEDLARLEVVRAGAVVLAARPVADVAVAVGVHVHAVPVLLARLPVARVLVARVVVVHAVPVPLRILHLADVLVAVVEVGLGTVGLLVQQAGALLARRLLLWHAALALATAALLRLGLKRGGRADDRCVGAGSHRAAGRVCVTRPSAHWWTAGGLGGGVAVARTS